MVREHRTSSVVIPSGRSFTEKVSSSLGSVVTMVLVAIYWLAFFAIFIVQGYLSKASISVIVINKFENHGF